MTKIIYSFGFSLILLLTACGQAPAQVLEESCRDAACSEAELNAPVNPQPEDVPASPIVTEPSLPLFGLPAFDPAWELKESVYADAVRFLANHERDFPNRRYVSVIDFSQHSSRRRWYLFDLTNGTVSRYLTSHGRNSDRDADGYATEFSNVEGSYKSSLGAYKTLSTYTGGNGHSLHLQGREASNSNAYRRAIVVHPAEYVQERTPYAGRSLGCPALDPSVSREIIEKIKDGSLLYIGK